MKLVSHTKSRGKNTKNVKIFNILEAVIIGLLAVISIIVAFINTQYFVLFVAGILCFIGYGGFVNSIMITTLSDIIWVIFGGASWVLFVICYPYLGYASCGFILLWIIISLIGIIYEGKYIKNDARRVRRNTYRKITKLSKSVKNKQDLPNFITPQQAEKEKKAK